jgi:hypothetical protein
MTVAGTPATIVLEGTSLLDLGGFDVGDVSGDERQK